MKDGGLRLHSWLDYKGIACSHIRAPLQTSGKIVPVPFQTSEKGSPAHLSNSGGSYLMTCHQLMFGLRGIPGKQSFAQQCCKYSVGSLKDAAFLRSKTGRDSMLKGGGGGGVAQTIYLS